jgi:hypothetical protein
MVHLGQKHWDMLQQSDVRLADAHAAAGASVNSVQHLATSDQDGQSIVSGWQCNLHLIQSDHIFRQGPRAG